MAQYNTGSVTLTHDSPVVTGQNTAFLTNVSIGDLFKRLNQNTLYEVAAIDSDTQLQLSANYAGSGESAASYTITRNFTPNFNIPEISSGDRDWPYVLTRGLRIIDAGLQVASTGGKLLTDENGAADTVVFLKTRLTGGSAGCLDSIDGADRGDGNPIQDGDAAIVFYNGYYDLYIADDDLGGSEASPDIIRPDTNAGDLRWVRQKTPQILYGTSETPPSAVGLREGTIYFQHEA